MHERQQNHDRRGENVDPQNVTWLVQEQSRRVVAKRLGYQRHGYQLAEQKKQADPRGDGARSKSLNQVFDDTAGGPISNTELGQ